MERKRRKEGKERERQRERERERERDEKIQLKVHYKYEDIRKKERCKGRSSSPVFWPSQQPQQQTLVQHKSCWSRPRAHLSYERTLIRVYNYIFTGLIFHEMYKQ